jgi:hypothetical protein
LLREGRSYTRPASNTNLQSKTHQGLRPDLAVVTNFFLTGQYFQIRRTATSPREGKRG